MKVFIVYVYEVYVYIYEKSIGPYIHARHYYKWGNWSCEELGICVRSLSWSAVESSLLTPGQDTVFRKCTKQPPLLHLVIAA